MSRWLGGSRDVSEGLPFGKPPPPDLAVAAGQVHVWQASLDQPDPVADRLWMLLSADERLRASSFVFREHRRRFTVARAALRIIVGAYLGVQPEVVAFRLQPSGKPELAGRSDPAELRFNVSHSHERALIAFALDVEVGVDLERIRPVPDSEQIVRRFFSRREAAAFEALCAEDRLTAFFRAWTGKEAWLKAVGAGLSFDLSEIEVAMSPGEPVRLVAIRGKPDEARLWTCYDVTPEPGYVATLAVASSPLSIGCFVCDRILLDAHPH